MGLGLGEIGLLAALLALFVGVVRALT